MAQREAGANIILKTIIYQLQQTLIAKDNSNDI